MRFGPGGLPAGYDWDTVFPFLKTQGLNAFEVEFVHGVNMKKEVAVKVKENADQNDVKLSIHAPYYMNLCGEDAVIEKSKMYMLSCAKVAEILDAKIVFHTGFYVGQTPEIAFKKVEKAMKEIVGKTSAVFAVETMGKQKQFGSVEEIVALCELFPTLVPCVDWAHIHARSFGGLKTEKDFENILSKFKKNYLSDLHQHFSNIFYTNGNERHHLPLSEKQPDFSILKNVLKKWDVGGSIISETPIPIEGAIQMAKEWKK